MKYNRNNKCAAYLEYFYKGVTIFRIWLDLESDTVFEDLELALPSDIRDMFEGMSVTKLKGYWKDYEIDLLEDLIQTHVIENSSRHITQRELFYILVTIAKYIKDNKDKADKALKYIRQNLQAVIKEVNVAVDKRKVLLSFDMLNCKSELIDRIYNL